MQNAPTTEETDDESDLKAGERMRDDSVHEDMDTETAAVSQRDGVKVDRSPEAVEKESKEGSSPNVSGSSDMVSGTPQKSISRRQSFITLEKYSDGKPTSPGVTSTFTGPHTKSTSSQKRRKTNKSNSPTESRESTRSNSQDFLSVEKQNSQCAVSQTPESPLRPKGSLTKCEPVRLTERLPRDPAGEDDVIPDTQSGAEGERTANVIKVQPTSQEETSQPNLDDSQSPLSKLSSNEPRRSGRHKVSPILHGEDPDERDTRYVHFNQKRGDNQKSDSQNSDSSQSGPKTRSRQAAEEESSKHRLRTRSQRDQTPSQGRATKKKLYSRSEDFLGKIEKPESRRRSRDSSQTDSQSDKESQSQGRPGRRSKGSLGTKEDGEMSKKALANSQDSSQSNIRGPVDQPVKTEPINKTQAVSPGNAAATEFKGPADDEALTGDSEMTAQSPEDSRRDSETPAASPSNKSLQIMGPTNKLKVTEAQTVLKGTNEDFIPEDNQSNQSNKQSEVTEPDKSEDKDFIERQNASSSQITPLAVGNKETTGVRTRRSKAGASAQAGSLSTPESSQSQSLEESADFSQGRIRYSRRRSSNASAATLESGTLVGSVPTKRGRKPRASLQSPLAGKSPETERNAGSDRDLSLTAEQERVEDSSKTKDLRDSDSPQEDCSDDKSKEVKADGGKTAVEGAPLQEEKQISNIDDVSHETGTTELQSSETCKSLGNNAGQTGACSLDEISAASQPGDSDEEKHSSLDQDHPVDPNEACPTAALVENQMECFNGTDDTKDEWERHENELAEAGDETASSQKTDEKHAIQTEESKDEEQTVGENSGDVSDVFIPPVTPESAIRDAAHDSPSKLRDLEALMGPDVNHSPSSHVRGTWSPSASPSTSILKKGQKRSLEDETPSPLVKVSKGLFGHPGEAGASRINSFIHVFDPNFARPCAVQACFFC